MDSILNTEQEQLKNSEVFSNDEKPICIIVLGMAGSGKTTFVHKLTSHLTDTNNSVYTINLDPAVYHVPYRTNIDIRDSVKFKEVMSQYGFGPNGAIMTSLNFFTAQFDRVLDLIGKQAASTRYVVFDTPGQIEVFTWSASGTIITEALGASYPTVIVYVMDTPRSYNPVTFMSNMLYACSVFYRMKLPFIIVMNKTDVLDCSFAVEWMRDFEAFQDALSARQPGYGGPPEAMDCGGGGDGASASAGAGRGTSDCSPYMASLTSSMCLVLDEFYTDLRCCGVSSLTGDGLGDLMKLVADAKQEYIKDFLPMLIKKQESLAKKTKHLNEMQAKVSKIKKKRHIQKVIESNFVGHSLGANDDSDNDASFSHSSSVDDEDDDESVGDLSEFLGEQTPTTTSTTPVVAMETATSQSTVAGSLEGAAKRSGSASLFTRLRGKGLPRRQMLVDMVGGADASVDDPVTDAKFDGVEMGPHEGGGGDDDDDENEDAKWTQRLKAAAAQSQKSAMASAFKQQCNIASTSKSNKVTFKDSNQP